MDELENYDIDSLLRFDGLSLAERITGKSYKNDEVTSRLGFRLNATRRRVLQHFLEETADTSLVATYGDYIEALVREGFSRISQEPFLIEKREEVFEIWWHEDGILLRFDTYSTAEGSRLNSSLLYYNWQPDAATREDQSFWKYISSGHISGDGGLVIWVGSHDGRQALRYNLRKLRAHGTFINPWREKPSLWLVHSGETDEQTFSLHKELTQKRLKCLPQKVQSAMGEP